MLTHTQEGDMSQIRDILGNRELYYVRESDTVAAAARRMADLQCGAILVLDDGRLRGVFSERDLMLRVVLERRDPETTPVGEVMTVKLVTIEESATAEEAMEQMHAHAIRHLAVMRGDKAVAFLSMRDLMHYELSRQTDELHHMRAYIHSA
jgi:CBS domain-containing protein